MIGLEFTKLRPKWVGRLVTVDATYLTNIPKLKQL